MTCRHCFTRSPIVRTQSTTCIRSGRHPNPITEPISARGVRNLSEIWPCGVRMSRYHTLASMIPYYNNARNSVYPRYTESLWELATRTAEANAAQERAEAEQMRLDTWRALRDANKQIQERQTANTARLKNRLHDIENWRNELVAEMRLVDEEQDKLKDHIRTLELARTHLQKPLQISEECLLSREGRRGIDEVKDAVERTLTKEIQLIKYCTTKLGRLREQGNIQLRMNQTAHHRLQQDLLDKNHALIIDNRVHELTNTSKNIARHDGIEFVNSTHSIPVTWVKYTRENLAYSQRTRATSENLRSKINDVLRTISNTVFSQFTIVNNALQTRIVETANAKEQLQISLKKVKQEAYDVEKLIQMLRESVNDKLRPLKLAETRLKERTQRQNVELCFDDAMKNLQNEVIEIRSAIRMLKDRIKHAEVILARLQQNQVGLEADIAVKENSLQIDQRCLNARRTFPIRDKRGSLFSMPVCY
ncbi:Tektin-3 [Fasciolopsis buskii]|uniref:Tektin n=1 Tax=Fasciolopsis buskii TaxID=27845 RepID=A0A8E0VMX2_9TREM|nr:Tektin-3 [Fasciolopsis buski]